MRLPSSAHEGVLGDWIEAKPFIGRRVSGPGLQKAAAVAVVPMVAFTIWLSLSSSHLRWPTASALYWGYLVAVTTGVGLYWWIRRPASRFGPLLVAFGMLTWLVSWESADSALPFDIGVIAEGPYLIATFYLFLAFPMGRLEPRAARWLMAFACLSLLVFFIPGILSTNAISGSAPLTRCLAACPANVVRLGVSPSLRATMLKGDAYSALTVTVLAFVIYSWRIVTASGPQRRALTAVAVTSLLFMPAFFVTNFSLWILKLDLHAITDMAWLVAATRVLLPLGFLIALVQAELAAGSALRTLLDRLAARPSPARWRDAIADALDDRLLELGYHHPHEHDYRDATGEIVAPPPRASGRTWVPIAREAEPVAAMVIDETLTENPEVVDAAATATLLAVENGALEGELRASRARILEAGNAERRRIERDLHDSAQQRLVALRIHLALVSEQLGHSDDRAMVESLGEEVDKAIDELRDVAHGVYPQVLTQEGLGAALRSVGARSVVAVTVEDELVARPPELLETTVYFCCVECLQNAVKHGGPPTSVVVRLHEAAGEVRFCVQDDGVGFDPDSVTRGAGLANLTDRIEAVGGTLRIDSRPGQGTRVAGKLPL